MAERDPAEWKPPIVRTVASAGEGIDDLIAALDKHRAHAEADGSWQRRRMARARTEVESLALARLRQQVRVRGDGELDDLAAAVRDGTLDAYTAADRIVAAISGE